MGLNALFGEVKWEEQLHHYHRPSTAIRGGWEGESEQREGVGEEERANG